MIRPSLSARRAWIEIRDADGAYLVESMSLSARRAWIEINVIRPAIDVFLVALRKESVDRNNDTSNKKKINPGRSPQGERG